MYLPGRGFPPKIPIVIPLSVVEVSRPKVMSWWVEFRVILLWQGWFSHLIKLSRLPICTVSTESYLAQITNCQLSFKRYGSVINPIPSCSAQPRWWMTDMTDAYCVTLQPPLLRGLSIFMCEYWQYAKRESLGEGKLYIHEPLPVNYCDFHRFTTLGDGSPFFLFHFHIPTSLEDCRNGEWVIRRQPVAWVVGVVELSVKVSEWANIHNNSIHTSFYFLSRGFSFLFCDGPRRELLQYYCCDWNNSEIKIGSANERVLSQGIALA